MRGKKANRNQWREVAIKAKIIPLKTIAHQSGHEAQDRQFPPLVLLCIRSGSGGHA